MCLFSFSKATPGELFVLFGYTFDRADIRDELIRAAGRGVLVRVFLDFRTTKSTALQLAASGDLVTAGVIVQLLQGVPIRPEYEESGRQTTCNGRGICHAKYVRYGRHMLLGSTNWTTSSRCNLEQGALLYLSEEAERRQYEREKGLMNDINQDRPLDDDEVARMSNAVRERSASRHRY